MRLLKLDERGKLTLTENLTNQIPPYAILSHTWGADKDEVTFDDVRKGAGNSKVGYSKIQFCGEQARKDGLKYCWVDTCCIDKRSSAELSEAINSMYQWYQQSTVCYAYLCDVREDKDFEQSAWFSRGWTLQELIAPKNFVFYNGAWSSIGSKKDLLFRLATVTGVSLSVLETGVTSDCSVAQRMSWAAKRITTRPEDRAYSLMGVFDINMPLLYGEGGERSFLRLQQEIIKVYEDYSIFAWKGVGHGGQGLLAPRPACFSDCGDIVQRKSRLAEENLEAVDFSITNIGLSINLWVSPWIIDVYVALLDCAEVSSGKQIAIFLRRTPEWGRQYARVAVNGKDTRYLEDDDILPSRRCDLQLKRLLVRQKYFSLEDECHTCAFVVVHTLESLPCRKPRTRMGLDPFCPEPGKEILPVLQLPFHHGDRNDGLIFPEAHNIRAIKLGLSFDFTPFVVIFSTKKFGSEEDDELLEYFVDGYDETLANQSDKMMSWIDNGLCVLCGYWKAGWSFRVDFLNLCISIQERNATTTERWSGKWEVSLKNLKKRKRQED